MPKRDDLLRFLHGELRTLEKMLDKPLPLGSAADRKAALRSVRAMRERVWNEGRTAGVSVVDHQTISEQTPAKGNPTS